jgi:hypothetical protein
MSEKGVGEQVEEGKLIKRGVGGGRRKMALTKAVSMVLKGHCALGLMLWFENPTAGIPMKEASYVPYSVSPDLPLLQVVQSMPLFLLSFLMSSINSYLLLLTT